MAEHISLIMGICSFVGGGIALYGAAVKKQYASERDFNHLKNNYQNLSGNIATLSDFLDSKLDNIAKTLTQIETRQSVILSQTRESNKDG